MSSVKNLMIGPCGHTYGIYKDKWSHITMRGSFIQYSYVYPNYGTGIPLISSDFVMKIDNSGSLWYSTKENIGFYNPFVKNQVPHFAKSTTS